MSNIQYTCFCRRSDATILAEYSTDATILAKVRTIMTPGAMDKCQPGKRIRLNTNNAAFHLISNDEGLIAVVVTSTSYPQRIVFSGLCKDLLEKFYSQKTTTNWRSAEENAFKKVLKNTMQALSKEYEDVASKNRLESLKQQVAGVQEIVGNNIEKALSNLESSDQLNSKSEALAQSADEFNNTAKKIAWKEWCAMMRMYFLVLAIVLIIIIIIFFSYYNPSDASVPAPARL